MRVAVELQNGTLFAYRFGRIIDGHHNIDVATSKILSLQEVLEGLARLATSEFPDAKRVVIQNLVKCDDNTLMWVDHTGG